MAKVKKKQLKAELKRQEKSQQEALTPAQRREREAVAKWEQSRRMGKLKYVLVKGTLAWSLMTSGIFILLTLITNKFLINEEILWYFLKMFIVFIGMGTLFGVVSWHLSERKFGSYAKQPK